MQLVVHQEIMDTDSGKLENSSKTGRVNRCQPWSQGLLVDEFPTTDLTDLHGWRSAQSGSVTLCRSGRRPALVGRMLSYPSAPHLSRSGATTNATNPMRSRRRDGSHPGGLDVCHIRHREARSSNNPAQRRAHAPLVAGAQVAHGFRAVITGIISTERLLAVAWRGLLCFLSIIEESLE